MKKICGIVLTILLFSLSRSFSQTPGVCSVQISGTNCSICNFCNGSAMATATGKAPYTYSWSPAVPNGQGTTTVSNLCPGTYTLTIKDSTGCTSSATVVITQPASPTANAQGNNILCNGSPNGSITVTASGGKAPLTYTWNPAPGTGQGTPNAGSLPAGTYTCSINDANGCSTSSVTTITQPPLLQLHTTSTHPTCGSCADGTVTASASGGTAPYSYSWEFITSSGCCASGLTAGNYTCCIKDANNCPICSAVSVTYNVGIPSLLNTEVISLSPNPFGSSLHVKLENTPRETVLEIFNMLGESVLEQSLTADNTELDTSGLKAGLYFVNIRYRQQRLLLQKLLRE